MTAQQIINFYFPKKIQFSFIVIVCISLAGFTSCSAKPSVQNKQLEGKWHVNFRHKDIGQARTIIEFNTNSNTFTAHSRKNADRNILGHWTSFLGRIFTKNLKNGSILNVVSGVYKVRNDTLHLAGILLTPMGSLNLEGYVFENEIHAKLRNKSRGHIGTISGDRNIPNLPLEDYLQLFQEVVSLTESKIFNREMLQTKAWSTFVKKMNASTPKFEDDLEMVFAFFYNARKLPFSHFSLMKPFIEQHDNLNPSPQKRHLSLEEKSAKTAYLKISSFSGKASEVDSIFEVVLQKGYQNLIVDLRNNSGGSVEAGMAFASNILDVETFGGVFLTQQWFNNHKTLPSHEDYKKLPHFSEANYDLIIEGIHKTEGLCLKIIPKKQVFRGKLFVLTNNRTASTCEPIVYELKKQKRAIVIGETTAGAMLNGEMFELAKGFKMVIPTADYYTSDGFRIDQNGVKPNIESKDALNEAMKHIGN
ncbi:MAG: S41 family peptidase [Cryomorphaceae bacterium]|nr:S41 family peptidase [Cryomorphaceae bacterium]